MFFYEKKNKQDFVQNYILYIKGLYRK